MAGLPNPAAAAAFGTAAAAQAQFPDSTQTRPAGLVRDDAPMANHLQQPHQHGPARPAQQQPHPASGSGAQHGAALATAGRGPSATSGTSQHAGQHLRPGHKHGILKAPVAKRPTTAHILNPQQHHHQHNHPPQQGGAAHQPPQQQQQRCRPPQKKRSKTAWLSLTRKRFDHNRKAFSDEGRSHQRQLCFMHAKFIQDLGKKLRLQQLQIATAQVYLHRFFTFHEPTKESIFTCALACLLLSGKVEEDPRKAKDILLFGFAMYHQRTLVENSTEYRQHMQALLDAEMSLLMTLAFDLEVDHPYLHLLKMVNEDLKRPSGLDDDQANELAKNSWILINHSLLTNLCVQYHPMLIAAVAIQVSASSAPGGPLQLWLDVDRVQTPGTPLSPHMSPQSPSADSGVASLAPSEKWYHKKGCSESFFNDIAMQMLDAKDRFEGLSQRQAARAQQQGAGAGDGARPTTPSLPPQITLSPQSPQQPPPEVPASSSGMMRVPSVGSDVGSSPMDHPSAISLDPSPASPASSARAEAARSRGYFAGVDAAHHHGVDADMAASA